MNNHYININGTFFCRWNDVVNDIIPKGTDWEDTADLNYDNPELRKAMIDAMSYWVKNADIDGFRCDVAMMIPDDFWVEAFTELRKIKQLLSERGFLKSKEEKNQLVKSAKRLLY